MFNSACLCLTEDRFSERMAGGGTGCPASLTEL